MKSPENYWDLLIDSGSNDNIIFINKNLQHHKATKNKYEKITWDTSACAFMTT